MYPEMYEKSVQISLKNRLSSGTYENVHATGAPEIFYEENHRILVISKKVFLWKSEIQ